MLCFLFFTHLGASKYIRESSTSFFKLYLKGSSNDQTKIVIDFTGQLEDEFLIEGDKIKDRYESGKWADRRALKALDSLLKPI